MRVFPCQCANELCGWYGVLEECSVMPDDHDRPACPSCGEDVESRQCDITSGSEEADNSTSTNKSSPKCSTCESYPGEQTCAKGFTVGDKCDFYKEV